MYPRIKRALDIMASGIAGLLLFPLMVVIAVIVKTTSKGNVLFRQKRSGRSCFVFEMLKFRTMRAGAPKDTPTHLLKDPEAFITPVGRFLRKSSLDELPQLWNVFIGDMSIVGPRPALWNQEDLISARVRSGASDLRPGLTGWSQVNGNKNLSVEQKAGFDCEYARNMSLLFDIRIIILTVRCLLSGYGMQEGASEKNASDKHQSLSD